MRDYLNQAVILAALHRKRQAQDAATRALQASPQSARAYLVRRGCVISAEIGYGLPRMSCAGCEFSPTIQACLS